MRERDIEECLRNHVRALGGIAYKFTSPGRRGVPDRLIVLPGKSLFFVELKAPGEKPTVRQSREHALLRRLGQKVLVIDSKESVYQLVK